MTGTFTSLIAAGLFLLVTHFGISSTPLRGALSSRIGEQPYLGVFSLISAVSFWWLGSAYANAPTTPLWPSASWQAWVPLLVVPVSLLLLVAGFSTPNPTAVGQTGRLDQPDAARGILRVTRNPFLWGVGLWALAHLVPNGDTASLVLFGTLAVLSLLGSVLIDAKLARRLGPSWERYAAETSNVPFAAILAGRQRFVWSEIGWVRLGGALVLTAALLHFHKWVFGVSPLPV